MADRPSKHTRLRWSRHHGSHSGIYFPPDSFLPRNLQASARGASGCYAHYSDPLRLAKGPTVTLFGKSPFLTVMSHAGIQIYFPTDCRYKRRFTPRNSCPGATSSRRSASRATAQRQIHTWRGQCIIIDVYKTMAHENPRRLFQAPSIRCTTTPLCLPNLISSTRSDGSGTRALSLRSLMSHLVKEAGVVLA